MAAVSIIPSIPSIRIRVIAFADSAFADFARSGKCASHVGGRVGARTATAYSQIVFLSSGGSSLNSRHSLNNTFVSV